MKSSWNQQLRKHLQWKRIKITLTRRIIYFETRCMTGNIRISEKSTHPNVFSVNIVYFRPFTILSFIYFAPAPSLSSLPSLFWFHKVKLLTNKCENKHSRPLVLNFESGRWILSCNFIHFICFISFIIYSLNFEELFSLFGV